MAVDLVIRTLDVLRAFRVTTGPHPVSTSAKINTKKHGYNLVVYRRTQKDKRGQAISKSQEYMVKYCAQANKQI